MRIAQETFGVHFFENTVDLRIKFNIFDIRDYLITLLLIWSEVAYFSSLPIYAANPSHASY